MNVNWNRWIVSSVNNHFRKEFGTKQIWFPNEERKENEQPNRYELALLGPDFNIISNDEVTMIIKMNILVITEREKKEPFRHMDYVGLAQFAFKRCINIYKLGPYSDVDDNSVLQEMVIDSPISTTPFAILEPLKTICRTTVEATYTANMRGS